MSARKGRTKQQGHPPSRSDARTAGKAPARSAPEISSATPARAPGPGTGRSVLLGGLIVAATLIAYIPAIRGGWIWDDNMYVTANQTLRDLDGLRRIWFEPRALPQYYPLVHTTFWIEYHLWGLAPQAFHTLNVLLHALGALMLWRLLARLSVPGAWFAAAVFALHPVHVESVAWITERKNVLSGVFYLGALLAYLPLVMPPPSPAGGPGGAGGLTRAGGGTPAVPWGRYGLAFALFVCALLSKTVTCTLPAAILVILWWKRERLEWRNVLPLAPLFVVGAAFGLATAWLEKHHVGAEGGEWSLSLIERTLVAGRVVWFYAAKLLWPHPLMFTYPRWRIDAAAAWQYLFPLTAGAVVVALWALRRRLGRGLAAGAAFFILTLFPALGFFNVFPFRFSFVADHFQYHASVGLIALFAAGGAVAMRRAAPGLPVARGAACGAVLALLAVLTWRQGLIYKDLETLYTDTLRKNPGAWMAHNNLGRVLHDRGQFNEAMGHYEEALRIYPEYPEGHNNLAAALEKLGRAGEALTHYTEAARLLPTYADAHYNLARLLAEQRKTDEAIRHYEQAVRLRPGFAPARNNLGNCLLQKGQREAAITHYREALRLRPDYPEAHFNLGRALDGSGDLDGAIECYAAAVRFRPGFLLALNGLGSALSRAGRMEEALARYREALTAARAQGQQQAGGEIERSIASLEARRSALP